MKYTNTYKPSTAFLTAASLTAALLFGPGAKTTLAQAADKDASPVVVDGKPAPALPKLKSTAVPPDATTIFRSAKTIYIKSSSILVKEAVIEEKLRKRSEFQQLGLVITRDPNEADMVLELKHDLFTMYVYTAIDPKTNIVVATGKLSSLGGTVAGKVAKRFLKQMLKARSAMSNTSKWTYPQLFGDQNIISH